MRHYDTECVKVCSYSQYSAATSGIIPVRVPRGSVEKSLCRRKWISQLNQEKFEECQATTCTVGTAQLLASFSTSKYTCVFRTILQFLSQSRMRERE